MKTPTIFNLGFPIKTHFTKPIIDLGTQPLSATTRFL